MIVDSLWVMLLGMVGIFIVMSIVALCAILFKKMTKIEKKDKQASE